MIIDEEILTQKLYRLKGILTIKLYRRTKRMDCQFVPYWKLLFGRNHRAFEQAKLLDHLEEEPHDTYPMDQGQAAS